MCLVCPLLYFCLSIHYLPVFTTSSKHCVQFNSLPACHQLLPLCSGGRAAEHLQREQGRTETEGKLDSTHTTSRSQAVIPILAPPRQEGKKQHGRVGMTPTSDTVHSLSLAQHKVPHTYFNFGFGVLKTLSSSSISGPLSLGFSISSVSYRRSKSSSTSGTCSAGSCSESRTYSGQKQVSPTLLGATLIPHHLCSPQDCSTPVPGGRFYSWC